MSKDKISQYSSTSSGANLNTDIAGINIDEGCPPSGINNAIRALMSQIKDLQTGVSGDTIPIAAGGTGEASAASARAALGVALNADVLGYVAPGAAGNFLRSTGTDWTSAALATAVSVTSVTAGAGISLSASTGDVTITNTGVTDITAGAGISLSANTGSITISAAGGGGFSDMQVFTSPGTWTNPGNITKVKVTVVGGGGGAGNGPLSPTKSGGGGGGAAIEVIPFPSATNVPVTVGSGGGGGVAGGTSSFGTYCSASGGGAGSTANNNGSGGNGSGGTINIQGGYGSIPTQMGGGSILGFGGVTANPSPTTGRPGTGYGGGGGSGFDNGAGGSGSAGVVIVEY